MFRQTAGLGGFFLLTDDTTDDRLDAVEHALKRLEELVDRLLAEFARAVASGDDEPEGAQAS